MAVVYNVGFLNSRNFRLTGFNGRDVSLCHISSKSVNPLQRYCDLLFFLNMVDAILDFFGTYLDHPWRVLGGLYNLQYLL